MITSIQYLRGLAALLVVLQHVSVKGHQYGSDPLASFHVGHAGVDIFFIISGFIMCHTSAGSHGSVQGALGFLKRRAFRILPLYWLLTLVSLVVFVLKPGLVNAECGNTKILESFILLPTRGNYLVANGWTLGFEFYFYFIFAIGMLFSEKTGRIVAMAILGLMVALQPLLWSSPVYGRFCSNSLLVEFIFGIGLYFVYQRRARVPRIVSLLTLLTGVGLLCYANNHAPTGIRPLDYGVPALLVCAGLVCLESDLKKQTITAFQMLGDSSYSLYLTHPFALGLISILFKKTGVIERGHDWIFITVLATGSITAGWFCYLLVEKPLTQWVKKNLPHHKQPQLAQAPTLSV